jgi:hypothetical protein
VCFDAATEGGDGWDARLLPTRRCRKGKGRDSAKDLTGPGVRNTAGGLRSVSEYSTMSAWEKKNWRG